MNAQIYSKPEVLLGDLRGGLCSSGLCKQLRSVAADEIERLTRERDELQQHIGLPSVEDYRQALERGDRLRAVLDRLYGARNLPDDMRIEVIRQVLAALSGGSADNQRGDA